MKNITEDIQCVIINWDGVCVSSVKARHMAYLETFHRLGQTHRQWTAADTVAQSGRNPDKIWTDISLWGDKGSQAKTIFYNAYTRLLPETLQLNDHIHAFITLFKIRESNTPLIAFGAKTQTIMQAEIERLVSPCVFDGIYGSQSNSPTNKDLSSSLALEKIVAERGITDKSKVLYLGYKESDAKAAANAGITYKDGKAFILDYLNEKLSVHVISAEKLTPPTSQHIK